LSDLGEKTAENGRDIVFRMTLIRRISVFRQRQLFSH